MSAVLVPRTYDISNIFDWTLRVRTRVDCMSKLNTTISTARIAQLDGCLQYWVRIPLTANSLFNFKPPKEFC